MPRDTKDEYNKSHTVYSIKQVSHFWWERVVPKVDWIKFSKFQPLLNKKLILPEMWFDNFQKILEQKLPF